MSRRTVALLSGVVIAAAVAVAVVLLSGSGGESSAPPQTAGTVHVVRQVGTRPFVAPGRRVGPTDPGQAIDVGFVLRVHQHAVDRFLGQVNDPASPNYHHFLSPAAYGRRFGLSDAELARLRTRVRDLGLRITASWPQRTAIRVHGTVGMFTRLLQTTFSDYRDDQGDVHYAPDRRAHVPSSLRGLVADVSDLTNIPPKPLDVPKGGLKPIDLARAYDAGPLYALGLHGEGQTVAVISYGAYSPQSTAQFDRQIAATTAPGPQPQPITVGSVGPDPSGNDLAQEDALDIQAIRGIAPQAQILDYQVALCQSACPSGTNAFPTSIADAIDRVVRDGKAKIVTISYGLCDVDPLVSVGDHARMNQSLSAAAAQGVSVLIATQDAGAYTCQRTHSPSDIRPTLSFPSDAASASAAAIAVGGTLLAVGTAGQYLSEQVWADTLSQGGGGGGISSVDPRPSWQTGPDVQRLLATGRRGIPDVSATADPDSGYQVAFKGNVGTVGGTSGATPFWAGVLALTQQYVSKQGGGPIGFVGPLLYRLGTTQQPFPPYHDVTRGNNRLYPAGPGWDLASGWGSPDVYNFARDVAAIVKG